MNFIITALFTIGLVTLSAIFAKERLSNVEVNEANELHFKNVNELEKKVDQMNADLKDKPLELDNILDEIELAKLRKEEAKLRKKLNGLSQLTERATILHKLGGIMFKQQNFQEALAISQEIVSIYVKLDGVDHINTAKALTNVGAVANRMKMKYYCELVERRALDIMMKTFGPNSKEVPFLLNS